eukprot:2850646-Rhodomonas_salina.1
MPGWYYTPGQYHTPGQYRTSHSRELVAPYARPYRDGVGAYRIDDENTVVKRNRRLRYVRRQYHLPVPWYTTVPPYATSVLGGRQAAAALLGPLSACEGGREREEKGGGGEERGRGRGRKRKKREQGGEGGTRERARGREREGEGKREGVREDAPRV